MWAERANQLTKGMPMGRIPWDIGEPRHFEVDLVHQSRESSARLYGHTIQLINVATGWSERVAVLGRGQTAMEAGFRRIVARLPFPIRELHPDNGSEFFNQHLVRFWKEKVKGVHLSRSRPYQKNDNRMVEQKNDTLVRKSPGPVAPGHPGAGGSDECALRKDVALLQFVSTSVASARETGGTRWHPTHMGPGANALSAPLGKWQAQCRAAGTPANALRADQPFALAPGDLSGLGRPLG